VPAQLTVGIYLIGQEGTGGIIGLRDASRGRIIRDSLSFTKPARRFMLPALALPLHIDQVSGGQMNRRLIRLWVIIATATVVGVLPAAAGAALVATDQAGVLDTAAQDRAKVQAFLDRASVREKFQAMGVDSLLAKDRVAALTDQEVHALAQKIDALPAGGNLSTNQIIAILLVVLLLVLLI
jgi:hypothetical protein